MYTTCTHHRPIICTTCTQHLFLQHPDIRQIYTPFTHHVRNMYVTFTSTFTRVTQPRQLPHSTHLRTIHILCTHHFRNIYKHFYTRYAIFILQHPDIRHIYTPFAHHVHNIYVTFTGTFTRVTQHRQLPHSTNLHTIYTTRTQC